MIFNHVCVCVVLKSQSSSSSLGFIGYLLRSLFQNNKLTARWWWWCSRIHMSREWALYGQVGVRLCRSLATGGVSEGAWLTHLKASPLLVMVLCCCLGMLTTNVTSAHGLALCPLSSTPTERRSVLFCAMRFLPMVLGEKRDSVISTCTSSGTTWRIGTGWLMLASLTF